MEITFMKTTINSELRLVDGMTVNERLFHFGLFDTFDMAVRSGQLGAVKEVLLNAKFAELQAQGTAETILASPEKYGF